MLCKCEGILNWRLKIKGPIPKGKVTLLVQLFCDSQATSSNFTFCIFTTAEAPPPRQRLCLRGGGAYAHICLTTIVVKLHQMCNFTFVNRAFSKLHLTHSSVPRHVFKMQSVPILAHQSWHGMAGVCQRLCALHAKKGKHCEKVHHDVQTSCTPDNPHTQL